MSYGDKGIHTAPACAFCEQEAAVEAVEPVRATRPRMTGWAAEMNGHPPGLEECHWLLTL